EKVNLPQSQLGFIDYLVRPFIDILTKIDAHNRTDLIKEQLEKNADGWKTQEKLGMTGLPSGWTYKPAWRSTTAKQQSKAIAMPVEGGEIVVSSSDISPPPDS
ncbi:Calcium/calmodulin-dependent 3',5'-cyclic nucleotide phosphodiesterase 1B, partial [Perkinsus olseni]